MRAQTIWQALMLSPLRFQGSRWPWAALLFGVTSVPIAIVGIALLIPTLLLLPLWGLGVAAIDRRRLRLLGLPQRPSGHVSVPREERRNWLNIRLTEPATWRETLSLCANLVFGMVWLAVLFMEGLFVAVPVAVAVIAFQGGADINLFGDSRVDLGPEDWWLSIPSLLLALIVFGYVNGLLASLHGGCVRWLIAPRVGEIDERVASLTRSRAAIVDANDRERRRIERDLHDGVQQELVAIAARLGLLELELASGDLPAARAALEAAQTQTERALSELRDTVRGIHPAVLSDHGLASALAELAQRSAIPLRIVDEGLPRLESAAETAAYFFVAEAVSNAAKHTAAPRVSVTLSADDRWVIVCARDGGQGGVDLARGSGLRGLSERADTLGGSLAIHSPAGGPTELTLRLPLGPQLGPPAERDGVGEQHAHSAR